MIKTFFSLLSQFRVSSLGKKKEKKYKTQNVMFPFTFSTVIAHNI